MVVDDAVVVRSLLARWVDAEPDMQIVASLRTGREAVDADRTQRCRRRRARHRHAGARRHFGAAAAPAEEARSRRDHGLDADPPQRRNQLARAWRSAPPTIFRSPRPRREADRPRSPFRRELIDKIRTLGRAPPSRPPATRPIPAPSRPARRDGLRRAAAQRPRARSTPVRPIHAAAVRAGHAARAADRLLDRRTAGADGADREASGGRSTARRS